MKALALLIIVAAGCAPIVPQPPRMPPVQRESVVGMSLHGGFPDGGSFKIGLGLTYTEEGPATAPSK